MSFVGARKALPLNSLPLTAFWDGIFTVTSVDALFIISSLVEVLNIKKSSDQPLNFQCWLCHSGRFLISDFLAPNVPDFYVRSQKK